MKEVNKMFFKSFTDLKNWYVEYGNVIASIINIQHETQGGFWVYYFKYKVVITKNEVNTD